VLEAIRNAIVYDTDGHEVRLFGGGRGRRSFVHESSTLAAKYPRHFKSAEGARSYVRAMGSLRMTVGGAGLAPASAPVRQVNDPELGIEAWRLPPRSEHCRVGSGPSPLHVRLSGVARQQVLSALQTSTDVDGLEQGGCLVGTVNGSLIEVLMASGSGPKALRGRDSFRSDVEYEAALRDRAEAISLSIVGFYHSHPCRGRRDLSREDLTAASTRRRELGSPAFLELVAVRAADGWAFEPWVVRRGLGADIAERAIL
jgi:proteasome lid subunit RPN8/RPN11